MKSNSAAAKRSPVPNAWDNELSTFLPTSVLLLARRRKDLTEAAQAVLGAGLEKRGPQLIAVARAGSFAV